MGRFVDLSKPLSAEDREYLITRRREAEVVINDRQFGHLSAAERNLEAAQVDQDHADQNAEDEEVARQVQQEEEEGYPPHLVEKVEPLTIAQLRTALKKRGLEVTGNKDELRVRLIEHLEQKELDKAQEAAEQETALREKQQPAPPV